MADQHAVHSPDEPRDSDAPDATDPPGGDSHAARHENPPSDDLGARLEDEAHARDLGDFVTLLEQALEPFLSSGPVSVNGNFFLGETRLRDAVGGDKYSAAEAMAFSGRVDSGEVPAHVLREIRATFVEPRCQRQLEQRLATTAVILHRVPSGRGATTSALRGLDRLSKGDVWKLNPEVRIGSLRVERLEEGGGYFVESLQPEQATALRPFHLERLSAELKERQCHLIVRLAPAAPLLERGMLDEWLFDADPEPPDAHELVRRHVARHLDVDRHDARLAFLRHAEVRDLIDTAVNDGLPVRRIADLSTLLTLVGQGQAEVSDVRDRISPESDDLFRDWFDGEREGGRLPFVLSLAVLDRLQESAVDRAERLLADRIRALEHPDGGEPSKVFGEPRRNRLAAARAECYDTVAMTQYGPSAVRALRYLDSRTAQRVLRHVWQEHGEARQLVVDWLGDLADDPARIVRLRAGGALGLLSLDDFEHIRRRFLIDRAAAKDVRHREVVLAALRIPARDPGLAPLVSRMMDDWSGSAQPARLKWTAARALGASVGRTMAGRALRLLRRLAAEKDRRLVPAIGDSVTELFMDHEKDLTGLVLDHLLQWTDAEESPLVELRDAGIACFLQLCYRVRVELSEAAVPWPTMLWLVASDDRHLRRVATLLHRTLDAPRLFRPGYELLYRWVALAGDEHMLREPLAALVSAVAQTPRDADALRGHLLDWRADNGTLTETIDVLLASLDERVGPGGLNGREDPE
ncbi:hypothetical protein ACFV80_04515 [Streptomyces sp. NPDC059862]|uniref:hypothetical protein n=1 Tax=Streptomyces sp. NPDC059862 TaxID=3346975 RepID=UPI0036618A0A